jgi:5'-3' exoribonuclease 2
MGIAGFFLWLQRHYPDCIDAIEPGITDVDGFPQHEHYDNFYLDMNGLIHPCCHDTAPLPEPETEEEMFDRIFAQIDLLVSVVRPRKCLVMCIDGVAPRSKMNQQRARRFRSAEERLEGNLIAENCADFIVREYNLPRPQFRPKWDHNVITPSTAFMERVALSIEWYICKKLNEDPLWRHLTVVFSDAHVPGEGEHKIMHYIRGLRCEKDYNPRTSHCIHGMDADLICLGLSTHEPRFGILRNVLNESFQPTHDKFCYFNLEKFRRLLRRDFQNIRDMDFERVIDDFIFLCFFVGNDFLPHMPLVSIKTKGIECLLDHYVRSFDFVGYLTKRGEIRFKRLGIFLETFVEKKTSQLQDEYKKGTIMRARAGQHVHERIEKAQAAIVEVKASVLPDGSNAQEVSNKLLALHSTIQKEQARFVLGKYPATFSYLDPDAREKYYSTKLGWDPSNKEEFEAHICRCCCEYLRGLQWVMRYYTVGCPSWEWYYPFHYTPLIEDLSKYVSMVNVEMKISAPLEPVEQLLAVLPRQSVSALPEELHEAVMDPNSVLSKFYPENFESDFTEAIYSYQAVVLLPFINCDKLKRACAKLVKLEPDAGTGLLFVHKQGPLAVHMERLLAEKEPEEFPTTRIDGAALRAAPVAGRVGRYAHEWPLGAKIKCPDPGVRTSTRYGGKIDGNVVRCYIYDSDTRVDYIPGLLTGAEIADAPLAAAAKALSKKPTKRARSPEDREQRRRSEGTTRSTSHRRGREGSRRRRSASRDRSEGQRDRRRRRSRK